MINATKNQLTNVSNPFQGDSKKVLCVCSAGLLRSPTLANVLYKELGYNTRACGTAENFALVPMSEALVHWADEIVFVDNHCKDYIRIDMKELLEEYKFDIKFITLDVEDDYNYMDDELQIILLEQYMRSK